MCLFIAAYMGFMWMLLLVAHGQRDSKAFFLNRHIQKSFSEKIFDSMSLGDMFTWANTSLLSNLYGVYPGKMHLCHLYVHRGPEVTLSACRLKTLLTVCFSQELFWEE